jgi:predicted PolB exonuclease-like 3'-5' exonuclease
MVILLWNNHDRKFKRRKKCLIDRLRTDQHHGHQCVTCCVKYHFFLVIHSFMRLYAQEDINTRGVT